MQQAVTWFRRKSQQIRQALAVVLGQRSGLTLTDLQDRFHRTSSKPCRSLAIEPRQQQAQIAAIAVFSEGTHTMDRRHQAAIGCLRIIDQIP